MSMRALIFAAAALGLGVAAGPAMSGKGEPAAVKLTQYDLAGFCDLAVGPDGGLHALFTERPAHGKPLYLYYRASTDGGRSWTDALNLSDDESGQDAGYARLFFDGKGRLYAAWRYVPLNSLLDGPGGRAPGRLVYRCHDGGKWSPRVRLGDDQVPTFSWFAAVAPDGRAHVVWSQIAADALAALGWATADYANRVRQATLDGPAVTGVKDLIAPRALLTAPEQQKLRAAGQYPKYEDTRPSQQGLVNLRGYITAEGAARFIAERPGIPGPLGATTGRQIVRWDGTKLVALYTFEKYRTYNTFNDPPALLVDAAGKEHLIRAPEKAEKPCVRDYPVGAAELGDPADVIRPTSGPGAILNWQAHQLPGGRMAVTAALSQKGGYDPSDTQLYVSFSDEGGKWSAPVRITPREPKAAPAPGPGHPVTVLVEHRPRFAALAQGKDGRPGLLVIDSANFLAGVAVKTITSSGVRDVTATIPRTEHPAVFFVRP